MPLAGGQDLLARMKDYDRLARSHRQRQERARCDDHRDAGRRPEDRRRDEDRRPRRARAGQRSCIRPSSHAAIEVGTPQIRNQGTVGGNVNQRPRCWYFRNEEFVCYKKGGSRCFAVGRREPVPRDLRQRGSEPHRPSRRAWPSPSSPTARGSASSDRAASARSRRPNTSRCRRCRTC